MSQSQYNSSQTYLPGQQVTDASVLYQATVRVPPNTAPPNSDFWSVVTLPDNGLVPFPSVGGGVGQVLSLTYNGSDPFDVPCLVSTDYDPTAGGDVIGILIPDEDGGIAGTPLLNQNGSNLSLAPGRGFAALLSLDPVAEGVQVIDTIASLNGQEGYSGSWGDDGSAYLTTFYGGQGDSFGQLLSWDPVNLTFSDSPAPVSVLSNTAFYCDTTSGDIVIDGVDANDGPVGLTLFVANGQGTHNVTFSGLVQLPSYNPYSVVLAPGQAAMFFWNGVTWQVLSLPFPPIVPTIQGAVDMQGPVGTTASLWAEGNLDPVAVTGQIVATGTTLPDVIAPTSAVLASDAIQAAGIDTTKDAFDVAAALTAANLLGTESLTLTVFATIAQAGPNQSLTLDWTTATITTQVGSDLSWSVSDNIVTITSAAGGVFMGLLVLNGSWD